MLESLRRNHLHPSSSIAPSAHHYLRLASSTGVDASSPSAGRFVDVFIALGHQARLVRGYHYGALVLGLLVLDLMLLQTCTTPRAIFLPAHGPSVLPRPQPSASPSHALILMKPRFRGR